MCPPLPEEPSNDTSLTAEEIVASILNDIGDLPRLMEFYYFWREPDYLDILRWLSTVPEDELRQAAAFIKSVPDGSTVRVERSGPTTLIVKFAPSQS